MKSGELRGKALRLESDIAHSHNTYYRRMVSGSLGEGAISRSR